MASEVTSTPLRLDSDSGHFPKLLLWSTPVLSRTLAIPRLLPTPDGNKAPIPLQCFPPSSQPRFLSLTSTHWCNLRAYVKAVCSLLCIVLCCAATLQKLCLTHVYGSESDGSSWWPSRTQERCVSVFITGTAYRVPLTHTHAHPTYAHLSLFFSPSSSFALYVVLSFNCLASCANVLVFVHLAALRILHSRYCCMG